MLFHQLFEIESSTYTYLLADETSKEAVIIDPVLETAERDLTLISELGLKILYSLETHIHADHVTGAAVIRGRTSAKTALSRASGVACADILLDDGSELSFGSHTLKAIATPGHTDTCMSYYVEGRLFTGDALLIGGTGRTDFQQGSSDRLYESIQKLFKLPPETLVYPAHDYKGQTVSKIEVEMKNNPRVGGGKTKDEFKKIMSELKLADPKKIQIAVPANLKCGEISAA